MTAEDFVEAIRRFVLDSAVSDCIKAYQQPPGRKPAAGLVALSKWFTGLDRSDQTMLERALAHAADAAVFGFLCVLDGVRAIEGGRDKGTLELWYVKGSERVLLNDQHAGCLHDLLRTSE